MKLKRKLIPACISNRGFTIVELIVGMGMSLVVLGAIYSTFRTQQQSYLHQERVATIQQNLRAAMFYMERELRMAGYDPMRTAGAGIVTSGASTITFTADMDGDGDIPPIDTNNNNQEQVTYALVNNEIRRNGNVIAEYIQSLNFVYLDQDGNGTVETVQVTIVAQTQTGTITSRTLTSNIKCRNIDL